MHVGPTCNSDLKIGWMLIGYFTFDDTQSNPSMSVISDSRNHTFLSVNQHLVFKHSDELVTVPVAGPRHLDSPLAPAIARGERVRRRLHRCSRVLSMARTTAHWKRPSRSWMTGTTTSPPSISMRTEKKTVSVGHRLEPRGQDLSLSTSSPPSPRAAPSPQAKGAWRTTAERRKAEIRHLRQKAVELKMRADFLRLLRDSRLLLGAELPPAAAPTAGHNVPIIIGDGGAEWTAPPKRTTMAAIWMDTALRQKRLRVTSEAENERLRDMVEDQRKMLASIRNMIKRHARKKVRGTEFRGLANLARADGT